MLSPAALEVCLQGRVRVRRLTDGEETSELDGAQALRYAAKAAARWMEARLCPLLWWNEDALETEGLVQWKGGHGALGFMQHHGQLEYWNGLTLQDGRWHLAPALLDALAPRLLARAFGDLSAVKDDGDTMVKLDPEILMKTALEAFQRDWNAAQLPPLAPLATLSTASLKSLESSHVTLAQIYDADQSLLAQLARRRPPDLPDWRGHGQGQLTGHLTSPQATAAQELYSCLQRQGWAVLQGPAGAGKTTLLRAFLEDLPVLKSIILAGPTNRAVRVLAKTVGAEEGRHYTTLHRLYYALRVTEEQRGNLKDPPPLAPQLLVLDESSMLDSNHGWMLTFVLAKYSEELLVCLVGDERQLPPVGRGEILAPLARLAPAVQLPGNQRATGPLAPLVAAVREGRMESLVAVSAAPVGNLLASLPHIRAAGHDLVICARRIDKFCYNAFRIQEHWRGQVPPGRDAFNSWQTWGKRDEPYPRPFCPFDTMPLRCHEPCPFGHDIRRGFTAILTSYRGRAGKKQTLELLSEEGETWRVELPERCYVDRYFEPAYALTVHDAQGGGWGNVGVVLPPFRYSPLLSRNMLYTAVSRARDSLRLYPHGQLTCEEAQVACRQTKPGRRTPLAFLVEELVMRRKAT